MAWYWPFGKKETAPATAPRRAYNGAGFGRVLDDWIASSTSQDAEARMAIRTLRNRARELARNNDYVVNALRAIQNNVIGRGVSLQSQIMRSRGPGAGALDKPLNDAVETAWEYWKRAPNCHVGGTLSFNEIERLLIRGVAQDGEAFVRIIRGQRFGKSRVPLALEIIEADLLDENFNGEHINGNQIRMGVEVDQWFRPAAYWFFTQHPGDIQFGSVGAMEQRRIRVPAADVIHLFRTERPGQTRGVPWMASAMTRLRHMGGYEEAEVIAARASACYMGFIQTPDPTFEGDMVVDGDRTSEFSPGKIQTLGPGEEFKEYSPNRPSGLLDPFMRYMLRGVAAGVGVSYETLSKDYSQSNYSSSRLAILDDRDTWRTLQDWMIEAFHQRVLDEWLDMAVLSLTLSLPGYEANPETYYAAMRWIARGWNWIDPQREIAAYKTAVRSGFMTLTDVVAQNGGDIEELFATRARELDTCDKLELIFDTDPELVTEQGQAQPAPIADDTGEDTASSGSPKGKAQDVVAS